MAGGDGSALSSSQQVTHQVDEVVALAVGEEAAVQERPARSHVVRRAAEIARTAGRRRGQPSKPRMWHYR
jgi:hypothetical protein